MVPVKVPDVTQVQVAQAKAPVAVVVRQADQPVCYERVLGDFLGLLAVA